MTMGFWQLLWLRGGGRGWANDVHLATVVRRVVSSSTTTNTTTATVLFSNILCKVLGRVLYVCGVAASQVHSFILRECGALHVHRQGQSVVEGMCICRQLQALQALMEHRPLGLCSILRTSDSGGIEYFALSCSDSMLRSSSGRNSVGWPTPRTTRSETHDPKQGSTENRLANL